jgi:hypothetical protein
VFAPKDKIIPHRPNGPANQNENIKGKTYILKELPFMKLCGIESCSAN